jgi:hypothetical protein
MKPFGWSTIGAVGLLVALASLAWAQQPAPTGAPAVAPPGAPGGTELGVRAPAPPPPPKPELGLEPTRPREETGAREQEFYPGMLIRSEHDPAFVTPFVADVPTSPTRKARLGLSGWTAPALPFDTRDSSGGVAFGITITWDVPVIPAPASEPEGPPASQR